MTLTDAEFTALRHTIGVRGTVRIALLPATILGWAGLTTVLLLYGDRPIAVVIPLAVLAAGFEAIHALHVGVERIGRFIQVAYEHGAAGPRWETAAMAAGPALPGGGTDPLFTVVFAGCTVVNLVPAAVGPPAWAAFAVLGTLHAAFVLRLVRARRAAARQRGVELERFRAAAADATSART